MSDKQPEALRLADALDSQDSPTVWNHSREAAAELRRLHALCDEMGEALEGSNALSIGHAATYQFQHGLDDMHPTHAAIIKDNIAALAKWKESK